MKHVVVTVGSGHDDGRRRYHPADVANVFFSLSDLSRGRGLARLVDVAHRMSSAHAANALPPRAKISHAGATWSIDLSCDSDTADRPRVELVFSFSRPMSVKVRGLSERIRFCLGRVGITPTFAQGHAAVLDTGRSTTPLSLLHEVQRLWETTHLVLHRMARECEFDTVESIPEQLNHALLLTIRLRSPALQVGRVKVEIRHGPGLESGRFSSSWLGTASPASGISKRDLFEAGAPVPRDMLSVEDQHVRAVVADAGDQHAGAVAADAGGQHAGAVAVNAINEKQTAPHATEVPAESPLDYQGKSIHGGPESPPIVSALRTRQEAVIVALGSNLGDPIEQIELACRHIDQDDDMRVVDTSALYESKPMYVEDQPHFVNGVCQVSR